jgi:hypothetical protein
LKLSIYRIYPISYEFQKFETYLEIDLSNSKDKRKRLLLQWATPAVALGPADESGLAHLGHLAQDKTGDPPVPHRRVAHRPNPVNRQRVAGEGGARELAMEVRVPIWGIGSGEAHRSGLARGEASRRWGTSDGRPEKSWRAPTRGSWSGDELGRRSLR